MKWRPKNWRKLRSHDFEQGADVMLEALREEGWRPEQDPDQRFLSHRAVGDMMTVGHLLKGVWIFIPDEE